MTTFRSLNPDEQIDVTKPENYVGRNGVRLSSIRYIGEFYKYMAWYEDGKTAYITKAWRAYGKPPYDLHIITDALDTTIRNTSAERVDTCADCGNELEFISKPCPCKKDTPAERDWSEVVEKLLAEAYGCQIHSDVTAHYDSASFRAKALRILKEADKPVGDDFIEWLDQQTDHAEGAVEELLRTNYRAAAYHHGRRDMLREINRKLKKKQ